MNPVLKKLKIAEDARIALFRVPEPLTALFQNLTQADQDPNVVFAFAENRADLHDLAPQIIPLYQRGNALWVAYPKKSGSIKSDMSRDAGWEPLNDADLLPVMQIALDDDWSALRWRYRDEIKHLTRKF